jgi:hypothetical protein
VPSTGLPATSSENHCSERLSVVVRRTLATSLLSSHSIRGFQGNAFQKCPLNLACRASVASRALCSRVGSQPSLGMSRGFPSASPSWVPNCRRAVRASAEQAICGTHKIWIDSDPQCRATALRRSSGTLIALTTLVITFPSGAVVISSLIGRVEKLEADLGRAQARITELTTSQSRLKASMDAADRSIKSLRSDLNPRHPQAHGGQVARGTPVKHVRAFLCYCLGALGGAGSRRKLDAVAVRLQSYNGARAGKIAQLCAQIIVSSPSKPPRITTAEG